MVGEDMEKHPIGVMPKNIWIDHRIQDLREAIHRYMMAGLMPPDEWFEELGELLAK